MTDWPKTLRVGGREYELSPQMSISEFTEISQTMMNEAEKFAELCEAMGMDVDGGLNND